MTLASASLDRIDQKILEILATDGRISYQRLAEMVHLTPRPCQERVKKLEKSGVITGYRAQIRLPEATRGLVLHLQVSMNSQHNRRTLAAFEALLASHPAVVDAWLLAGSVDYQLRIRCPDMEAYQALSNEWLADTQLGIERIICVPEIQVIKCSTA